MNVSYKDLEALLAIHDGADAAASQPDQQGKSEEVGGA